MVASIIGSAHECKWQRLRVQVETLASAFTSTCNTSKYKAKVYHAHFINVATLMQVSFMHFELLLEYYIN